MDRPAELGVADRTPGAPLERVFADEAAFRVWYDGALPRVYGYLYHRCGRRRDLAEDLTQQVFFDALRAHRQQGRGDEIGWLLGIARHRLVDHFRRLERQERGLLRLITVDHRPEVAWIGEPMGDEDLAIALIGLPAAQRAAIVLRYVDDLPVREVARLLGRSEGAVESLLSRGRDALRRQLGDREP